MSSMFIVFHSPVGSGVHPIAQVPPSSSICPGSGIVGLGVATTTNAKDKTKAEKAPRENIGIKTFFAAWYIRGRERENEKAN
jgi:hypothetical protein